MGVDIIIKYKCDPKEVFGDGNQIAGIYKMLDMVKSRNRAAAIAEIAASQGKKPEEIKFEIIEDFGGRPAKLVVDLNYLLEKSKPLDVHKDECSGCPANTLNKPYGCSIGVRYPITTKAQGWLLNQLQKPGTVGRNMFLSLLDRHGLRGKYIQHLRKSDIFEQGVTRDEKVLDMPLSSDLVFELILGVGEYLQPTEDFRLLPPKYCLALLICLGCLQIEGGIPTSKDDLKPIKALEMSSSISDRQRAASFNIGEQSNDFGIAELQGLLFSIYTSWIVQSHLLVWS